MKKILTSTLMLLTGISAHAVTTPLIALNSEAVPGKTAYLGVSTNSKNQISGMYYKGIYGTIENFSVSQLTSNQQVLFAQKGYDLIKIELTSATEAAANLKLTYLKNAISGAKGYKQFRVRYNPSMNGYELNNAEGRTVQNGYITTNRNALGMEVGISDVKTW